MMAAAQTHSVAPATSSQVTQLIPLDRLVPSPTNPRKHFDKAGLEELAASIREKGVLQPILARPNEHRAGHFEVVAGERRYRAAKAAGLTEIPGLVRELSDAEALEVQVIENLQRQDLHPLEEAEGYEQLQKIHGYAVEDLAAKVGKSKAYVYARMKLCALVPEARKAFYADALSPSTALLVARIPVPELQKEALKEVTRKAYRGGDVMSYREACDYVQRTFMLRLAEAPFPADDAELVPAAGPCTTCPKRTGNQRELFGDIKSADVCTDPECFGAKRDAAWARMELQAKSEGRQVLDTERTKKLFPHGGRLSTSSTYVDLAEENWEDEKSRTWGRLLGKVAEPHVVIARDPIGNVHRLVPKDRVAELMKEAGHKVNEGRSGFSGRSGKESARLAAKAKAERAKTILDNKVRARVLGEIRTKVATPLRVEDLRLIAEMFFNEMHHDSRKELLGCLEVAFEKGKYGYDLLPVFRKHLGVLDGAKLSGVLVVMCISPRDYWQGHRDPLPEVAKRYKVDQAKLRKEVLAAQAKPKEKGRAAAKAKAGKARGKRKGA